MTTTRVPSAAARRACFAGAALLLPLVLVLLLQLAAAGAAQAAVWVIPSMGRAFPSTTARSTRHIDLKAAGNEYQAVQVALRGGGNHSVTFTWSADSDPLITANTTLCRVGYVHVKHPTTDLHSRAGLYPDPLLPRAFGQRVSVPGFTTCFFVQVHVPYGTAAGDHTATLHVANGSEAVDLPVSLHVYSFGWSRLSSRCDAPLNVGLIGRSLQGSGVRFSGAAEQRILNAYFTFLAQHGITPSPNNVWPRPSTSGHIDISAYGSALAPLLDPDGLDLPDARLPWVNYYPWSRSSYGASCAKLETYLTDVCKAYAAHGWQDKAYAYIVDETIGRRAEQQAQAYARTVHRASAKAGFRCPFLLTDDPRPRSLGGVKTANSFLFNDVDIWAPRYYYFFGRVPVLRQLQAQGKQVWWYFYANHFVARTPSLVIDKPHSGQRVIPWLMQQWHVDGMLNWGLNRWADAYTGKGWRDPYKDTLSYRKTDGRVSNGETCLIYPGYYPRLGLKDPYAPPVSSLRLEALRDGFQDREYLQLARQTGDGAAAFVKGVIKTITWDPYGSRYGNFFKFPKYTDSAAAYTAARAKLAQRIEAYQGD